MNTTESL